MGLTGGYWVATVGYHDFGGGVVLGDWTAGEIELWG